MADGYRYPDLPTPPPLLVAEPEEVGAYEAKTHLPRLLEQVQAGQSFVITRHGQPVARLVPAQPVADIQRVIREMREFARGNHLGDDLSIRQMIEEGRR